MSQLLAAETLAGELGAWTHRSGPLYRRLADAIRDAVEQGALEPGTRLPSERLLATALDVSRGTAVAAYAELVDAGVVVRRRGSGTTIAGQARASGVRHVRAPMFNRTVSGPDVPIDLQFGGPYADDLVLGLGADVTDTVHAGAPAHGYMTLGLPALRERIAARLTLEGIPSDRDDVLITAGAQGALHLLTAALVRRGDRVVVEAPTYPGALEVFSRLGAVMVGVRRDSAGPRIDELRRAFEAGPPALVFLVPTCHNPTGSIMSEARRREVLALCREHEVLVVEDLTTADLVFDGHRPAHVGSFDPERVVNIGSFSKVLWGGLRVGWIRATPGLVLRLGRLKAAHDLGIGMLDQAACAAACDRWDELVAARRTMAREHHAHFAAALAEQLPEWRPEPVKGGYSMWVRLPRESAEDLAAAAMKRGVALSSGAASAPEDLFLDHVRLCFVAPPDVLTEAAARLRDSRDEVVGRRRPTASPALAV